MTQNNRVYKTGTYELKNPQKYKGFKAPVYKSSFEWRMFYWCDCNEKVVEWSYECITVEYEFSVLKEAPEVEKSLVDWKTHKYYPDVFAKLKDNSGNIVNYLLEIKPYSQTIRPVEPKKKTKKAVNKYLNALQEYLKNTKKWEAARIYAKKNNMEFVVLTERQLFS